MELLEVISADVLTSPAPLVASAHHQGEGRGEHPPHDAPKAEINDLLQATIREGEEY